MKLIKRIILFGAMLLGAFSVTGYISNLMTRNKCEVLIANKMLREFGSGQISLDEINLIPPFPSTAADVLKAAGLKAKKCDSARLKSQGCFPWMEMESRIRIPFVITIYWGGCDAPLSGIGYQSTFVCLFGKIIRLSEESVWVS